MKSQTLRNCKLISNSQLIFTLRYGIYWDTAKIFLDKSVGLAGSLPQVRALDSEHCLLSLLFIKKKLTLQFV